VARPVVLGTEIDQALFVAPGMIRPERIDAVLGRLLIKPNARKQPPRCLDTLRGCSAPLVRYDLGLELCSLQLGLVRHREYLVVRGAVMRQNHQRVLISLLAQPLYMRGERLALRLIIVQHADFAADKLSDPDHGVIGFCASTANIPECLKWKKRIGVAL
jgi:hypothetical protein